MLSYENAHDCHAMKEYKIISQQDDSTYQILDKNFLQESLNEEAKSGWCLHSVTSGSVPGGTSQNEYIIFLERDKPEVD